MDMLTSCSHVLSQGDGSDFYPGCNWEATPPGYSACESLQMIGSTPQGHACPDLLWQPRKAGKNMGMLTGVLIVGEVGNGAAEEDWLGFKPRHSSHDKKNHLALSLSLPHSL